MIIAIDGPAGTGKTTIAKAIAKEFNINYLNTGSLYRAIAYYFVKNDLVNHDNILEILPKIHIDIELNNSEQHTFVNGEIVDKFLRQEQISMLSSKYSAFPEVRQKLIEIQRNAGKKYDIIAEGRDIGTVVFPNADVKFFLDASSEERANRRYLELKQKGESVDKDVILADIVKRDYNDSHRAISPLKKAEDALYIDTTSLTINEVVTKCIDYIKLQVRH